MSQVIQTIPKISRIKKQDVLYVVFKECDRMRERDSEDSEIKEYENYAKRDELIKFLDVNGIKYKPAFAYEFYGWYSYDGCLYIDIEFDASLGDNQKDEKYKILNDYLTDESGKKPKDEDILFYYLTYSQAVENAEFDEPDFWDDF